ncbi:MAG: hypothetical protein AAGD07_22965 [Planctomycetota bacterium]
MIDIRTHLIAFIAVASFQHMNKAKSQELLTTPVVYHSSERNSIDWTEVRPEGPRIESIEIAKAIVGNQMRSLGSFRVIAWCVFVESRIAMFPKTSEDAIVLFEANEKYVLAHCTRGRSWRLANELPEIHSKPKEVYASKPSENEVAGFIQQSTFGNNSLDSTRRPVYLECREESVEVQGSLKGEDTAIRQRRASTLFLKQLREVPPDRFNEE